jgi:hypothetical protein
MSFSACRDTFRRGIIEGLLASEGYIQAIGRTAQGIIPVSAIALDIYPWHAWANLSLRLTSDPMDIRYAIADWPHFDFVNQETCSPIREAAVYAAEVYRNPPASMERIEIAHLIFLAGAEALLDESIAETLNRLGIDAPNLGDGIKGHWFEYLVLDPDGTVRANYCEIVRANRSTDRLIDTWRPTPPAR